MIREKSPKGNFGEKYNHISVLEHTFMLLGNKFRQGKGGCGNSVQEVTAEIQARDGEP